MWENTDQQHPEPPRTSDRIAVAIGLILLAVFWASAWVWWSQQ